MLKSVQFKNFKVLRDATLPLSRFTLIVGPNGSGKSTALQAIEGASRKRGIHFQSFASAGLLSENETVIEVILHWAAPHEGVTTVANWTSQDISTVTHQKISRRGVLSKNEEQQIRAKLERIKILTLDAGSVAAPAHLQPKAEFDQHGSCLAGIFDRLRDEEPERFEALNDEVGRWFPEFDRILFDTPAQGQRAFLLRTRKDHHKIPAASLSQGTLLALAILTLGYFHDSPLIVGLEEPDRGIHPRLLRQIQDALYRLSYPENFGEKRDPVQVIATTHSPYFLDLYKDHPEEVVIAQRTPDGACFERLSEQPHIIEILGDAPLGEVWYSGILGGVPAEQ